MLIERREPGATRPIAKVLYVARWLVMLDVLLATELRYTGVRVEREQIIWSLVGLAILTLAMPRLAVRYRSLRSDLLLAIADVATVSVVVYFSDGIQSPFYPLFYIAVISTATTFGMSGGLWLATAITVISLTVEAADTRQPVTERLVLADFVSTTPYLFFIAVIAGALRDRARVLAEAAGRLRAEQEAVGREMEIARRVQQAQLPVHIPEPEGAEIAVWYRPAKQIGGDLYDFHPVEPKRLGILIADVAGKSVPGALLVSAAKYAVREHFAEDLAEMMAGINGHLMSVTASETFVTMLYGVFDLEVGRFRYVNAGHMPPIILRGDGSTELYAGDAGLPLAVEDAGGYTEQWLDLAPGDTLVLYTDGLTDALADDQGGIAELQRIVGSLAGEEVRDWPGLVARLIGVPRHVDDITMVAVRLRSRE